MTRAYISRDVEGPKFSYITKSAVKGYNYLEKFQFLVQLNIILHDSAFLPIGTSEENKTTKHLSQKDLHLNVHRNLN